MRKERMTLKVADLHPNNGQLPWLPKNPRQWTQTDIDRTAKSIQEDPDFLEDRPLLVATLGVKKGWLVFAGNLRLTAAKKIGLEEIPCVAYARENEEDEMTIKRRAMKDNGSFGSWDFDLLANEWDDLPLTDWGVPAWENEPVEDLTQKEKIDKDEPEVEALLNEAMRTNVRETLEQIDHTMKKGWLCTFVTKGLAQAKFIRAKYYGEHYPQWVSLYFCPQRFWTSASKLSCYDAMTSIAKNETDAGIAGLRTLTGDHLLLLLLLKGSYPFAIARMPMDFPANTAADLMREFAPGGSVLDPCHGWGGRLVGAMMSDASLYVGCDPSQEAHDGLVRADEAFRPYAKDTKTEFILSPFEDADLGGRVFDMAITSPPYFDVEQYHGEGQSHVRYPKYDLWRDGFYHTLIEKTYGALKPGGVFVLQVGSKSYPLLEDGKAIAKRVGFRVEEVRPLGGGTASALHDNTDEDPENEKIIILRK